MGMSAPAGAGVKSDINITPLVDVMLVLLIIFMVVTPMLQDGVDVQMAATKRPPEHPKDEANQITISMKFSGAPECAEIWFRDEWQPYERPERCEGMGSLESKLTELRERRPGAQILIKADRRINFGSVKKVMKTCNTKGFEAVALIVQRDTAGEAS